MQMKPISFFSGLIIVLFVAGCTGPKVIAPSVSNKTIAEKSAAEGNYAQAVVAWKKYFGETSIEKTAGSEFAAAAQTAFKSGDSDLAVNWFDQARYKNHADAQMYLTLAEIYRQQKNISKELTALEYIATNYPNESGTISERMFQVYHEIKEPEKALSSWNNMGDSQKKELVNLAGYFDIKKELKDTAACDTISLALLEKDPQLTEALEWNAFKYYWMGENRYQREMAKYNKNKTNRQYVLLLNELNLSTADFKKSLTFLEKLWKINPGEKYAGYFANIYARFSDEAKSNSYKKYLKN
jgi:tetratricopeptide (TPR) repeat protein